MDQMLNCYFDQIFVNLNRGSLFSRHKRKEIVDYFKTLIAEWTASGQQTEQDGCRRVIAAIIRYHQISKNQNGAVCLLGKYHNVLYIAIRLSFDYRLNDSKTISILLSDLFQCEKTFERLFAGAIFGVRVSHFIAGWKSDFENQYENIHALLYFSYHATKSKLCFQIQDGSIRRFLDVPMTSLSNLTALKVAFQVPKPDIVLLLLRHGCMFVSDDKTDFPSILKQIADANSEKSVECLKMFKRASKESGFVPAELKHLCRCKVREVLRENWQLPFGIEKLPLPKSVLNYLDLLED